MVADWEPLDADAPEERACFAAVGIQMRNKWLTEGRDAIVNRLRNQPLLSAYHLAEWFAWNWWRLRWEPRSRAADWEFAHRLSCIGAGYIWPDITISSDGERTALIARPTLDQPQTPFRYIANFGAVIPATEFESEVDRFIAEIMERLESKNVESTNLHTVWNSVCEERLHSGKARKRKLEALLGYDPDKADATVIDQLQQDTRQFSRSAIEEIAAEHGQGGEVLKASDIYEIAAEKGFDGSTRDTARLVSPIQLSNRGQTPAWRIGGATAQALRAQLRLGSDPISDAKLTEIGGVVKETIQSWTVGPNISFVLEEKLDRSKVVLRSKWRTGRRFEFARLLGDRIASLGVGNLFPATRSYTYRQKLQRSFAAEFLSPFETVEEMLDSDYSMEKQLDVAEHFEVSPLTIRTLLVNHGSLKREDLNDEIEATSA
jgi:hypothetical protein